MFKAYYYGLPASAVKLAREGFAQIYGAEDVVELSEVPAASIKLQSHMSATRNDVVAFIVPDGYADNGQVAPSIVSTDKYIPYSTDARLVEALNARGAKLDAPTGEQPLDPAAFMHALAALAAAQGANTVAPQQAIPAVAPDAVSPNVDVARLQAELDAANQKLAEQEALLNTRASESDRIAALEADATRLAREKADLEKQVMHGGSDVELRKRLAAFERSPFARLDAFANADSILTLSLPTVAMLSPTVVKNLHVLFPGTGGAVKTTYKLIQKYAAELAYNGPVCVIDLNVDSLIDYRFGTNDVTDGRSWLTKGNGPVPYTDTSASQVSFITMGARAYMNDLAYLLVDWAARLAQVAHDGKQIILVGPPANSMVARVLYMAFAAHKLPTVIIDGDIQSLRATIINLGGLNPQPRALIYNPSPAGQAQQLIQHIARSVATSVVREGDRLTDVID
jgi:hypothetical protein